MKVRIHKRDEEDVALLVDWNHIEPYWIKSTFAPIDRNTLLDAYCDLWFDRSNPIYDFTIGEITLSPNNVGEDSIIFENGRHRTNLIIKHQPLVPVAFIEGIPTHKNIQASVIKHLKEGDIVDIPDLPIYSILQMRALID